MYINYIILHVYRPPIHKNAELKCRLQIMEEQKQKLEQDLANVNDTLTCQVEIMAIAHKYTIENFQHLFCWGEMLVGEDTSTSR